MKLKCDPITVILIIGLFVAFGGGVWVGNATAPKEINQYQYITQEQSQMQAQGQITVTVIDGKALQTVTVQLDVLTNIRFLTVSNGITNCLSNYVMMTLKKLK